MKLIEKTVAFKLFIASVFAFAASPALMAQATVQEARERDERSANFTPAQEAMLDSKQGQVTYEDLAHEHRGCPANSVCSEQIGKKMKEWEDFMSGLKN